MDKREAEALYILQRSLVMSHALSICDHLADCIQYGTDINKDDFIHMLGTLTKEREEWVRLGSEVYNSVNV